MWEVRAALVESGRAAGEVADVASAVRQVLTGSRAALWHAWAGTSRAEPSGCLAALDRAAEALDGLTRQAQVVKVTGDRYHSGI